MFHYWVFVFMVRLNKKSLSQVFFFFCGQKYVALLSEASILWL